MSKLNLLIERWKAGSIKDPDLSLALKVINDMRIERLKDERISEDQSRVNQVSGEASTINSKRSKTKGF